MAPPSEYRPCGAAMLAVSCQITLTTCYPTIR